MIFTHTDVFVRVVDRTSLANDDVASLYGFSTELLETKSLTL